MRNLRKLPFLLALLLMSLLLLGASASAHALTLPFASVPQATALAPPPADEDDEEGGEDGAEAGEDEDAGDEESGFCASEDAREEAACEEELKAEEAEECVLEDADASFTAAPGAGEVRLRVHYRATEPTAVLIDARLRGSKGSLHLGRERVRFRHAGVYRLRFQLGAKQMAKAVAAKDFEVNLRAAGTPAACGLQVATRAHRRAR